MFVFVCLFDGVFDGTFACAAVFPNASSRFIILSLSGGFEPWLVPGTLGDFFCAQACG
jgi:hypothetical protein